MPAARRRAKGRAPARPVVVVSDQLLVADAVAAALNSLGLRARSAPWPVSDGDLSTTRAEYPEIGLALIDSTPVEQAAALAALVAGGHIPWIVLTSAPVGPVWDAVRESGLVLVLPHHSSLGDVVDAAVTLTAGEAGHTDR